MEQPTVNKLAAELADAYTLLMETLPLALRVLKTGPVDLREQQMFWNALSEMEIHAELLDLDEDDDFVAAGLIERRDELVAFCFQQLGAPEEGQ